MNHPLVQFIIFGFAMLGFFILVKMLVGKMSDNGVLGDIKKVVLTA